MMEPADIRYLVEPRSVAVLEASADRGEIGYKVIENIPATPTDIRELGVCKCVAFAHG